MTRYREESLPLWAQRKLAAERATVEELNRKLEVLQAAHVVLSSHSWFTIPGPTFHEREAARKLWFLDRDDPLPACNLGPGDLLLVGRAKETGTRRA